MDNHKILEGKKILIVDDEPDILETLDEMLDMCIVDTTRSFEEAKELLDKNTYDAAILDIMGVYGYDLLKIANAKNLPTLMLTAHALSPEDFIKSIEGGAKAYIPKEKMTDIHSYLADMLHRQEGRERHKKWYTRIKPFFDRKFGSNWYDKHKAFWDNYQWLIDD